MRKNKEEWDTLAKRKLFQTVFPLFKLSPAKGKEIAPQEWIFFLLE